MSGETKEVEVLFTWRGRVRFEVPVDWEVPDVLDGFEDWMLEEITPDTAELVDWE